MWNKHMHDYDDEDFNPLKLVVTVIVIIAIIGLIGCIMQGPVITIDTAALR